MVQKGVWSLKNMVGTAGWCLAYQGVQAKPKCHSPKGGGFGFHPFIYKKKWSFICKRPALDETSHKLISAVAKRHLADFLYAERKHRDNFFLQLQMDANWMLN